MKFDELNLFDVGHTIQLAGAVFGDADKLYLCLFPDETGDRAVETLDMDLDEWKLFIRQTDLLEVEILQRAADGKLAKAILRKSARQIEQGISWKVFRRDGFRCRYCGADNVPLTVDHLVLWEEGGPSTEANLVSACRKCNKTRGNMPYAEWLKHPRYRQMSRRLDGATRAANEALVKTLDGIPRQQVKRSR